MPSRAPQHSDMLLLVSLYYLVVFSRPDKDILKQYLLKIPVPGRRLDRAFPGGLWEGNLGPCPSSALEPLAAVIALG